MQHRWPYSAAGSDLDPLLDRGGNLVDGLIDRNPITLLAATVPERDGASGHVIVTGQQHVRHLLLLRGPDLLLHTVGPGIDLNPDAALAHPRRDVLQVRHMMIGDR